MFDTLEEDGIDDFIAQLRPVRQPVAPPEEEGTIEDVLDLIVPQSSATLTVHDVALAAYIDPSSLVTNEGTQGLVRSYAPRVPAPTTENAWWHLYRLNLMTEEKTGLPRIIDANEMQVGKPYHKKAVAFQRALAQSMGVKEDDIPRLISLKKALPSEDNQEEGRTNSGSVFENGLAWLLSHVSRIPYRTIAINRPIEHLPGFCFDGRGVNRRPDIVLYDASGITPHTILSLKWSSRGDRGRDNFAAEAACYRSSVSSPLRFCAVVNEFEPGRLRSFLDALDYTSSRPLLDALYHVNLDLLQVTHGAPVLQRYVQEGRLRSLADLLRDVGQG